MEVSIVLQSHFGLCFLCTGSFFQFLNAISMRDGENKCIYDKRSVFLLVLAKGMGELPGIRGVSLQVLSQLSNAGPLSCLHPASDLLCSSLIFILSYFFYSLLFLLFSLIPFILSYSFSFPYFKLATEAEGGELLHVFHQIPSSRIIACTFQLSQKTNHRFGKNLAVHSPHPD